jgi:hypothetical protein
MHARATTALAAGVGLAVLTAGTTVLSGASAAPASSAEPSTATVSVWQPGELRATVRFTNASHRVRTKPAARLERLAEALPEDARKVRGRVVGMVQRGGSKKLSVKRAKSVRRELVNAGVDARWKVRGIGAHGPTARSRKATVVLRYEAPRPVTVALPAPVTQKATTTVTASPTSTPTVTETTTAVATATVTATATATATATVTVGPPVNLTLPTVNWDDDEEGFVHTWGTWESGLSEPVSFTATWQGGYPYSGPNHEPLCKDWFDHTGWTTPVMSNGPGGIPDATSCTRVRVTAVGAHGTTTVHSAPLTFH